MLQSSEHQNDQTQKQFLPSGNPSHEHLTLNVEHTTLLYIIYLTHILIYISNLHISYLYIHNCLYYILCFCYFVHCLFCIFVYYSFIICVLSCRCHSVALWSFCHYNKFLLFVNIPGNKAHSLIIILIHSLIYFSYMLNRAFILTGCREVSVYTV